MNLNTDNKKERFVLTSRSSKTESPQRPASKDFCGDERLTRTTVDSYPFSITPI